MYASTHEMPLFPGTGEIGDRGVHDQIVNAPLRAGDGGEVAAAAFTSGIPKARLDRCRNVPQIVRATDRLVDKAPGALDLAQMPFRQREVGRHNHLSVPAEPEPTPR